MPCIRVVFVLCTSFYPPQSTRAKNTPRLRRTDPEGRFRTTPEWVFRAVAKLTLMNVRARNIDLKFRTVTRQWHFSCSIIFVNRRVTAVENFSDESGQQKKK